MHKDFASQVFFYFFFQGSIVALMFIGPEPAFFNDNKKGEFSIMWLIIILSAFLMQHISADLMVHHASA